MKKWFVTVGLAFTLAACGGDEAPAPSTDEADKSTGGEASSEVFEVAVIPSQSTGEMETGLNNLEEHLNEALDREVEVVQYPNYNAVVEALNYNHIDLAFLGPLTYLIAHEQSGAQAIITQEIDGEPYYYSYIITHADSEWETLEDMLEDRADVNFAFASNSSTSGHLIPGLELRNRGHYEDDLDNEFAQIQFAGSHDVVTTLVQDQTVEAGAVDSAILESLMKDDEANGGSLREDIKVIWQSDQLYQYPWVVPSEMTEEEIENIRAAFYDITDEEILRIFGGASSFVEADDTQYADVLEAAREFDMLKLEE
ncbi:phosphate/phosphite/phosphonate ABC transporter substrate-binding protein [Alkalihalophilus lindianensis]|uniref:Phosphate/phosphite/phosphonate ABC transporter substrate-binding protein n=1 Tax=Alkalihalophilus lindianensis TaxID=1630542 RepID=A0ABU3X7S6_9BACI|nr:phosphate/phosphite/phosphonate ABC transporter substrate-binding protein [Alkalihalophilus lindianensis]MDV2683946.1 phosphate/phosphite/phosphonate ABC transporter substrate-binding protein [Alkalihalophilus lindianensis]